jgi:tetratricopeptide (TPR) repeat protein
MDWFRQFVHELHRRSVWQVLGVYLFGSALAYEVILNLTDGLGLPGWVPPLALALIIVGLPMVVATAVVQEGGPGGAGSEIEGLERTADVVAGEDRPEAPARTLPVRAVLTWRRFFVGAIGGFALLGAGAAGYMGMRTLGIGPPGTLVARGELEPREPVVLGRFENRTRDPFLAGAITEALRVDLHASPVLEPLDPTRVQEVLERMQRPEDTLDLALAREVAVREGLKAAIGGEVATLGSGIVLTARVVAAEDGRVLASFRETARDSTGVIDAVDALSRSLRAKAGESLSAVRASPPLAHVTTSSLEALRIYARAGRIVREEGDYLRALPLYEEATRLDSTFAMAYRAIGVMLGNMEIQRARRLAAIERAYALRDRLTARERGLAEASYHTVRGNPDRAAAACRSVLARYPNDNTALHNLAVLLTRQRRYEEAHPLIAQTLEHDPGPINVQLLASVRMSLGDTAGARAAIEFGDSLFPDNLPLDYTRYSYEAAHGNFARADSMAAALAAKRPGSVIARGRELLDRTHLAAVRGKHRRQRALTERLLPLGEALDAGGVILDRALDPAMMVLLHRRAPATALRMLEAVLARYPLDSFPPADRPYLQVAELLARTGEVSRAEALLAEWEAEPTPYDPAEHAVRVRAHVRAARGDLDGAIALLRNQSEPGLSTVADLGMMYDRAGVADSAIVTYRAYLDDPYLYRFEVDVYFLGPILERLAVLYDDRGDRAAAAGHYAGFIELWQDADPALQPRVEAARRRLQRLTAEGAG